MNHVISVLAAALILWAVWYVLRAVLRQLKGDCAHCTGDCAHCKTKRRSRRPK